MFSKFFDSGIELLFGNFSKKKNKRIYIISAQLLIIISIFIATNVLKLKVDLAALNLDVRSTEIINAILGISISGTLFLYFLSICLFIIFILCEGITSTIKDNKIDSHSLMYDKVSEMSSWFLSARLGNIILASRTFDYFVIGVLMSIILKQSHHQLIYRYFSSILEGSNPFLITITALFLLSIVLQLINTIKAIHYHFFHFQSEMW